jgi:sulfur relay (sulfurtransferase) DsrF/TusC family protein
MAKSILTIVAKAPYGREDAFAGLRFALSQIASGVMDKSDAVLIEDGVYNVLNNQKSEEIGMPSNFDAAEDVLGLDGKIFCIKEDMDEREIAKDNILEDVEIISRDKLSELIQGYEAVTTF